MSPGTSIAAQTNPNESIVISTILEGVRPEGGTFFERGTPQKETINQRPCIYVDVASSTPSSARSPPSPDRRSPRRPHLLITYQSQPHPHSPFRPSDSHKSVSKETLQPPPPQSSDPRPSSYHDTRYRRIESISASSPRATRFPPDRRSPRVMSPAIWEVSRGRLCSLRRREESCGIYCVGFQRPMTGTCFILVSSWH